MAREWQSGGIRQRMKRKWIADSEQHNCLTTHCTRMTTDLLPCHALPLPLPFLPSFPPSLSLSLTRGAAGAVITTQFYPHPAVM
uniref:Uncharacterized protein n=1 Tax=Trypanosoma vivax (strain Y486) TaxID=1055687 RepID=G0U6V8_TRYVY|nr:hypothetical protein TVY486_1006620 [Trypanosoma vivax Y486]